MLKGCLLDGRNPREHECILLLCHIKKLAYLYGGGALAIGYFILCASSYLAHCRHIVLVCESKRRWVRIFAVSISFIFFFFGPCHLVYQFPSGNMIDTCQCNFVLIGYTYCNVA